jgi:type IV fimbrial biogenesis protein FimT
MTNFMRQRGFTLIELMVVVALVAVMMTLAVPGLRTLLVNQRLNAAASDLQSSAMQARSTALKFNQRVIVQPTGGAWADGYRIYIDTNQDSSFSSGSDTLVLTPEAPPAGVTIIKETGANNYFGYEGSGFLASSISGSSNASWKITAAGTDRIRCLIIERSGRARVHDPRPATTCPTS